MSEQMLWKLPVDKCPQCIRAKAENRPNAIRCAVCGRPICVEHILGDVEENNLPPDQRRSFCPLHVPRERSKKEKTEASRREDPDGWW